MTSLQFSDPGELKHQPAPAAPAKAPAAPARAPAPAGQETVRSVAAAPADQTNQSNRKSSASKEKKWNVCRYRTANS